MATGPVFEEYEPATDCGCAGCALQRRAAAARTLPPRLGGHPAAHGARRALVLATAAGVVLSAGAAGAATPAGHVAGPVRADDLAGPAPGTPQGRPGPLGDAGSARPLTADAPPAPRTTTRREIIARAKTWVAAKVPYTMEEYWSDGYRQDCSGYVSMAWDLGGNEWTGSLSAYGTPIARAELEPGDILLFHNPADPAKGSHVTIFGGWTNGAHSQYMAYEQTPPATRKKPTPLAYWSHSDQYTAYRYNGLTDESGGGSPEAFPGAAAFGPGADNAHVTRLGDMLVARGGGRFYAQGPGPVWSDADRRATRAFQRAQGWKGAHADGLPGPDTWRRLVQGAGRSIPPTTAGDGPRAVPAFPGRGYFKPGQSNAHVERLGEQLVRKGYGRHYASGPGRRWTEADRRNVEAFQRAQGWRGGVADGYPGPDTWRRLFS
ncbi:peptidoglycan-binding protein [Streptomyces sp. AM 2-1-1]|uniref:peptidoglycan-binding protein n=1 Tax=Streptomyces sp. AM 2-1-1 TaxID=3028709 RepID=UPI0023B9C1AF|nr:peptidoglycan-binding protein [Streptomyces sp. AM 2-1-1]WEH41666.1 peptidoglycan-binding protein [Streptomyces sp. AM 2-1-1]